MSNHFRLLVEVPADAEIRPSEEVSDKELVSLIRPLYRQTKAQQVALESANCVTSTDSRKRRRGFDGAIWIAGAKLDVFIKELKQPSNGFVFVALRLWSLARSKVWL